MEDCLALRPECKVIFSELERRFIRMEESFSEVSVRLATLTSTVEGYKGNQEQMLMMMQRMITRHDEQLNGHQEQPGLAMRLDRIEQRESGRIWHIRALWGAVLSFLVARFAGWGRQ